MFSPAGNNQIAVGIDRGGVRGAAAGYIHPAVAIRIPIDRGFISRAVVIDIQIAPIDRSGVCRSSGMHGRITIGIVEHQSTEGVWGEGDFCAICNIHTSAVFHDSSSCAAAGNIQIAAGIDRGGDGGAASGDIQKTAGIDLGVVGGAAVVDSQIAADIKIITNDGGGVSRAAVVDSQVAGIDGGEVCHAPAENIQITAGIDRGGVCDAAAGDSQIAAIDRGFVRRPAAGDTQLAVVTATTINCGGVCRSAAENIHIAVGIDRGGVRGAADHNDRITGCNDKIIQVIKRGQNAITIVPIIDIGIRIQKGNISPG